MTDDPNRFRGLFISDIHMSNKLPHAHPGERGVTDRLQDQLNLWKRVARDVEEQDVEAVVILGDLFDKALVDPVTLTHTVEAIINLPCEVRILAGNHDGDKGGRGGERFNVEAFAKMDKKRIRYLWPEVMWSPREWLDFYPVPFGPSASSMEQINKAKAIVKKRSKRWGVLLMHHSIIGCSHLGWTCDDGLDAEKVCDGFNAVYSGHFHEHQRFGPDLQGMYLGAPMHHHYGDVGRGAGYWIITFQPERDEPNEVFIDPGLPKFHAVEIHEGIWHEPDMAEGDYVRLQVHATHAEWTTLRPQVLEVCAALREKGYHATFKHKAIYHHEVRLGEEADDEVTMEDYIRKYVDKARSGDISPEQLVETGLGILAKARDAD